VAVRNVEYGTPRVAGGSEDVVMLIGVLILRLKPRESVPAVPVTCTLIGKVPAVAGVPEMTPAELMLSGAGSPDANQISDPVPPDDVNAKLYGLP
jgi:hypothetical protein